MPRETRSDARVMRRRDRPLSPIFWNWAGQRAGRRAANRKRTHARLAKLCRSSDPNVSLKEIEAFQKREAARASARSNLKDDHLNDERLAPTFLRIKNGVLDDPSSLDYCNRA